jgi:hypothetical protein
MTAIEDGMRVQRGKKVGTVCSKLVGGGFYVRWDGGKRQVWVAVEKLTAIAVEA